MRFISSQTLFVKSIAHIAPKRMLSFPPEFAARQFNIRQAIRKFHIEKLLTATELSSYKFSSRFSNRLLQRLALGIVCARHCPVLATSRAIYCAFLAFIHLQYDPWTSRALSTLGFHQHRECRNLQEMILRARFLCKGWKNILHPGDS